jgi:hypothetical protein
MYKTDIGINAGVIWHLLSENGALTIEEIQEITGYKESLILLSLGWLSREDKIYFFEEKEKMHVALNEITSELYY